MGWQVYDMDTLTEQGDDSTLTVLDGDGRYLRDYTASEKAAAASQLADIARQQALDGYLAELAAGIAQVSDARDVAALDAAVALALDPQIAAAVAASQAQSVTVSGWSPRATYTTADMLAIRAQLKQVIDRQTQLLQAVQALNAWRSKVDAGIGIAYSAVLWLARTTTKTT